MGHETPTAAQTRHAPGRSHLGGRFCKRRFIGMGLLLFAISGGIAVRSVMADEACCCGCGTSKRCGRVCRLVCDTREVEVTLWACCREDLCVPGPGCRGGKQCEEVCVDGPKCDDDCPTSFWKSFTWYRWTPGKAHIKTRKKLYRKTVTRQVPIYRWVIEDVCCDCEACLPPVSVQAGATVPPPPPGVRVAVNSRQGLSDSKVGRQD